MVSETLERHSVLIEPLELIVVGIGDEYTPVRGHVYTCWIMKGSATHTPCMSNNPLECAVFAELLDSVVVEIRNIDVTAIIDSHSCWGVEFTWRRAGRAKRENEVTFPRELLNSVLEKI